MTTIISRNEEIGGLYVYGSGEMDQLSPIKEDEKNEDVFVSKTPFKIPLHFISPQEKIKVVNCGQMFTMILSTEGNVYTFGCADNGGIGHEDSVPAQRVNINFKPIGISGGDCHGLAYNENSLAFWGQFRNSSGGMGEPCLEVKYYNINNIQNEHFKKVISGTNHVLILTKEKNIFSLGNKEYGQRGINPNTNIDHLTINKLIEFNIDDIFTGDDHSFLIKKENNIQVLKSWGLNSKGQLGIGTSSLDGDTHITIFTPTRVHLPDGLKVKKVCGGSGNSICLTEDNRVFIWGANDDNILGLETDDPVINTPREIVFFNRASNPDNEINEIVAAYQSFYARNTINNKVYSWGTGDNYILGNKKERTEKKPFLINSDFFKNLKVSQLDMGCNHVAVLLSKDDKEYNYVNKTITQSFIISAKKRKNDDIPYENNSINKIENGIREENIILNIKDRPKVKIGFKSKK